MRFESARSRALTAMSEIGSRVRRVRTGYPCAVSPAALRTNRNKSNDAEPISSTVFAERERSALVMIKTNRYRHPHCCSWHCAKTKQP